MTTNGHANGSKTMACLVHSTHAITNHAQISHAHEAAFVGRIDELVEIARHFQNPDCRLVNLVGLGGVGKTRIAWETAAHLVEKFPHGVYFVPLVAIATPDLLVPAIAAALGYSFQGNEPLPIQIISFLRSRHLLLILDNFEHLISGGVDLLVDILQAAPDVRLLITSRERLNLREEWVIDIRGLDYPADETNAENFSAVQLFVQNARQVKADFQLADANRADVIRICRLVEGLPLGIELAAAWVRALSCRAIGDEIAHNLDFLTTNLRNMPEKHRSMRAVFARSYDQLSADQQQVFNKLSVFRGGFQREAAESVTGTFLMMLADFVDKSLLHINANDRYDIHELLRQYAEEQLEASGAGERVRQAHSAYYADFLSQRVEDMKGRRQTDAITEVNGDFENVRTAWMWAADHKHWDIIEQMIDGLQIYCRNRDRKQEGFALFRSAEQKFAADQGEVPQRLWGCLLARSAAPEVFRLKIETALEIARRFNDPGEIAFCLAQSGHGAYANQEYDKAIQLYEQSLAIYRQLGDRYHIAEVLFTRLVDDHQADWDDVKPYLDEILRLQREIGDRIGLGWSLAPAAINEARLGNFVEVERLWLERITVGHELGNLALVATGYAHISHRVYFVQGNFAQAQAAADEAIKLGTKINRESAFGWALPTLGLLASMNENYAEGKRLCLEADSFRTLFADIGKLAAWGLAIASCGLGDYDEARIHLSAAFKYLTNILGVVGEIASLPLAAIIRTHQGQPVHAVELLALAFTHPVGASGWMKKWPLLDRLQTDLKHTLGSEVFSAAWERGKQENLNDVITELQTQFSSLDTFSHKQANQSHPDLLSPRELEVLVLIADGLTNREIANHLFVGVSTVKKHIQHIYAKLDAKNRTLAVVLARELNLLP